MVMKTIFITCFTGLITRNILSTDAFDLLRVHPDLRIVIIAPESRAAILRREYGGPSVSVAAVAAVPLDSPTKLWWVLATNLLATGTRRVQRRAKLERDGGQLEYVLSGFVGWLGRSPIIRRLFRGLTRWLPERDAIRDLISRYQPNLIFATDVYTPYDVELMRAGERRGIAVTGMVRSWDNVTSKTLLAFVPERIAVNTQGVKEELVRYGDVPAESVFICGIPHYERYREERRTPREEFFRRFGLDPKQKLVLFTPPSDTYLKSDPVAPVILKALETVGAQVLVRLALVGKTELGGYQPPTGVVLDAPANSPDFIEVHMDREADRHLADSISHADVVVTWASTMIIDAVVFDKPVVLVGFDATRRPYGKSIQQYYDYDHQRRILETGGAKLARSPEELFKFVERYLEDPGRDRDARARLRDEYCGPLDGKSGERLARYLLEALDPAVRPRGHSTL